MSLYEVAASPVRWKRPLAGAAVAAGAALAAVLLVRPGPESDGMLAGATVTAPPLVVSLLITLVL